MDTKSKKKSYKKTKVKDEQENINPKELPVIKVAEFSNVEELAKIFEVTSSDIIQICIELGDVGYKKSKNGLGYGGAFIRTFWFYSRKNYRCR